MNGDSPTLTEGTTCTIDWGNEGYAAWLFLNAVDQVMQSRLRNPEKLGDIVEALLGYLILECDYPAPTVPNLEATQLGNISKANAMYILETLEISIKETIIAIADDWEFLYNYAP